ncbi:MAG: hypothetical protein D3923_01795 [Candidatus Electrothrix sp. AR3]|nr:hypothetical protein [Candidatus Electrothrix sp. AR3]
MDNTVINTYREVIVPPRAAGREAVWLIVALCLIGLLAGLRFVSVAQEDAETELKGYQLRDINVKNQAPVLYRSLLGAMDSITWFYEAEGSWPDIAQLEQESLPPFAANFLPVGLRGFSWKLYQGATWVDYYGVNQDVAQAEKEGTDPLENSFILRIIDQEAGKYPYPYLENGQKNRFSAQIWINTQLVEYPGGALIERGWKWIVSGNAAEGKIIEASR